MKIKNYKNLVKALENEKDNALIRLVYVSNIIVDNKSAPLLFDHIRSHSEKYNRSNNIKGMLCNNNKCFLQCLEGTKAVLMPLMARIFNDDRHDHVRVTLLKTVDNYSFNDWRMRSLNLDDRLWSKDSIQANSPELKKFLPFRPFEWSEWYTEHFLETMRKFDDVSQSYNEDLVSYNIIYDPNFHRATLLDSTLFHRFLLVMVVVLLVVTL
ncbi:BLUF domain-containing protein, partial [Psychrobacter sp.]|uniref:BLUF domain-containing protein n=1 Tax=Psychrobacter sp. TaxID=56811 RepID=UPI0025E87C3A